MLPHCGNGPILLVKHRWGTSKEPDRGGRLPRALEVRNDILAAEKNETENPQHRAERNHRAVHRCYDDAIGPSSPLRDKAPGQRGQHPQPNPKQNPQPSRYDKNPREEARHRFRCTVPATRHHQHRQPHPQMEQSKATEQGVHSPHYIMKDPQQPQLFSRFRQAAAFCIHPSIRRQTKDPVKWPSPRVGI